MIEATTSRGSSDSRKATRREWLGLVVITLPCLMYAMDITVLNVAVPHISADLQPTSSELLWIIDIYTFLLAGLLITMGTLGDRIGRRRLLLIGAAGFGMASVLAAVSDSTAMLITARALLGVAGATLAPSTLSLLRNMFLDSGQRAFAIGVWTISHSVGAAIGPLAGGVLLARYGWGSVFLIGVPAMAVLLVLGPFLLPEFKSAKKAPLDLISACQSLVAVLLVTYGLKQTAVHGWNGPALICIALGTAIAAGFVRRQSRSENPFLNVRLLQSSQFTSALLSFTLGCFVTSAVVLFVVMYLQLVLGFSAFEAGLWTLPITFGYLIGSMLTPAIMRHVSSHVAIGGGFMLAAVGLVLISQVRSLPAVELLAGGLFVFSLGLAPVYIPSISLMVGAVPPERAGEASSISETGSEFGAALGIAVLGSVGNWVYRNALVDEIPAGITEDAAKVARDTLGGAHSIAQQLPAAVGEPLLIAARAAFVESVQVVSASGAAMAIAMAIGIVLLARSRSLNTLEAAHTERLDEQAHECRH